MRPFKFFQEPQKQTVVMGDHIVTHHNPNPYQDLVITMIRESNRLNIPINGMQEMVYNPNRRISNVRYVIHNQETAQVNYRVDLGGEISICGFNMWIEDFNTATSI